MELSDHGKRIDELKLQNERSDMSQDLQALLNMRADQVERPPILPVGDYIASIAKHEMTTSSVKQTPGVELTWKIMAAHESVDMEELEKVKDWRGREITDTFYITPKALWRLTGDVEHGVDGLAQHLGIDTAGKSVLEVVSELDGKTAMISVTREQAQNDKSSFYNRIKGYQRVK